MTDYNEVYRRNDYAETQTRCRELLGGVYLALVDHEARATDWTHNQTVLSVKANLMQALDLLVPKMTEAQQIEEAAKRG